jgi:hypothetical protein
LPRKPSASWKVDNAGWTDPEGSRPWLGALLLAYYDPDGRLATSNMPLDVSC